MRTVALRLEGAGGGECEEPDAPGGGVCPFASDVVADRNIPSSANGGGVSCTLTDRLANSRPDRVSSLTVATPTGPQAASVMETGGSNISGNDWGPESPTVSQEPYLRGPLTTNLTIVSAGTRSYAVMSVVSPSPRTVRDALASL